MGGAPSAKTKVNNQPQIGQFTPNTMYQQSFIQNQIEINSELQNSIQEKLDPLEQKFFQQVNNEQMQCKIWMQELQNENQQLKIYISQYYQYIQRLEQEKSNLINQGTDQALASQYLNSERKVRTLESDNKELEDDKIEYKTKMNTFKAELLKTKQALTLLEDEYKKLSEKNEELKQKINQQREYKNQTSNNYEQTNSELKEKIEKLKKDNRQLQQIIEGQKNQIENQNNEINNLKNEGSDGDMIFKKYEEIQSQKASREELLGKKEAEIKKLQFKIQQLEFNKTDPNLSNNNQARSEEYSARNTELMKSLQDTKMELDKKDQTLIKQQQQFQQQIVTLKQENIKAQEEMRKTFEQYQNEQKNELSIAIKSSSDKLTSIRSRLQMIFAHKSHEEQKIQNLIEESYKKLDPTPLSEFEKYENGNINEIEVEIFEVEWDQDQINRQIEAKNFFKIYKTMNTNYLGSYKGHLTMSSMGENQLQQIKLFKVLDDNQSKASLKNSVFGLIQNKTIDSYMISIKEATQLVTNSAICDYYLKTFVNECKKKDLYPAENFQIGKQYIIKNTDNQFYQAEILTDTKIVEHLGGLIKINNDFMAAFSYFTYIHSNNELLISYLASIGHIIYNPYVCTRDGILTQVDLGVQEINNISEKIILRKNLLGSYIILFDFQKN